MKKLILFWIVVCFSFISKAQIVLEHTYNHSATLVQFETLGIKYYLMDVPNAQCRIYHLDHSLYKTIPCNVPNGFYLSDVKFLSENLFDQDAGIELLCTFYRFNSAQNYYEYDSKIIDETGTELVFIDGSLYNFIHKTGENSWKLFSYCYDFSIVPEKVWTNIYQLPGIPVVSAKAEPYEQESFVSAWPNPSADAVKMVFELPAFADRGNLILVDMQGKIIAQYMVDHHTNHVLIDVQKLSAGIYSYFIDYGSGRTASQKLSVQ